VQNHRPGEMELFARELMLNLARIQPPVNKLKQLEIDDPAFLEKIFWQMIFIGLEWFPSERWFVEVGLKNAAYTDDAEMRKRLLDIGSERFYTDSHFLREMYYYKLENRDAAGAAGVVNQLIKQYPDDLEPIYLGLKLSLLTTKKITYHSFRKLAITKGMPAHIIELFDVTFDLLSHDYKEAMTRITDFEREFPQFQYYATALRYIANDFAANDEIRVKKARKALLDTIDQYCAVELKTKSR
jgi:tetratricopeptide (TPR) repeat protein